ncbi:MAG: SUMF1/EgtB/PvdO family nonheme iron enzyme [Cyanobacteria bacterium J06554_1]
MSRIFLSYRRSDSLTECGRIYDHLESYFGEEQVFRDVDSARPGYDFTKAIKEAISKSQVVLVIIGSEWTGARDDEGNLRLHDSEDWVRQEIELALDSNALVIPVLLDEVSMPKARELPGSIEDLARRNAIRVRRDPGFKVDIKQLIDCIEQELAQVQGIDSITKDTSLEIATSPDPKAAEDESSETDASVGSAVVENANPDLARDASLEAVESTSPEDEATEKGRRDFIIWLGVGVGTLLTTGIVGNGLAHDGVEPSYLSRSRLPTQDERFHYHDIEVVKVNSTGDLVNRVEKKILTFSEALIAKNTVKIALELVNLPQGQFLMGSPKNEEGHLSIEGPQHRVILSQPFWMSKYLVTQRQWKTVAQLPKVKFALDPSPSKFKGDERPVERISWNEATEFCNRLSKKTGHAYRLPTETEWEYACRANSSTAFSIGPTLVPALANYNSSFAYDDGPRGIYRKKTIPVGLFPPNGFGLHDMHGNVWEWCLDYGHNNYSGMPADGSAWTTDGDDNRRIARGGSWLSHPKYCRSAARTLYGVNARSRYIGFRVVCSDESILS